MEALVFVPIICYLLLVFWMAFAPLTDEQPLIVLHPSYVVSPQLLLLAVVSPQLLLLALPALALQPHFHSSTSLKHQDLLLSCL